MPSFLLCAGDAAERLLPDLFTAFSCAAAPTAGSLDVFCLSSGKVNADEAASLAAGLTELHRLMDSAGEKDLFPGSFALSSCCPVFRSALDLSEDPSDALLVSALRGKGLPLSTRTDREAVEWCFADLLSRPDDPSVEPFFAWLGKIEKAAGDFTGTDGGAGPVRLALLADLADPFAAGIALALLHDFRSRFAGPAVSVTLLALAETASPVPDGFTQALRSSLQTLEDRALLRKTDSGLFSCGADAAWLLSLPSSLCESPDSFRFIAPFAARVLASACGAGDPPSPGLHTLETEGTLSVSMLGSQALRFAETASLFTFLVSDVFPALRHYLSHPARLRSIALNPRTSLFRKLLTDAPAGASASLGSSLDLAEKSVRQVLSLLLRWMRAVPSSLRYTSENASLWQQAVAACGRTVTVASEYDVSTAEAHENGLDAVRPVHRVSLADTDEELLVRRLEDMKKQLDAELASRGEVLASLGGYRSMQVRLDCLSRCRRALEDAKARAAALTGEEENLTILKAERRIRLLQAAVARCEAELDPARVAGSVSVLSASAKAAGDAYAGTVFLQESCHLLEGILGENTENNAEPLSAGIPLFPEAGPLPDWKTRWKALQAACKDLSESSAADGNTAGPLPLLLSAGLRVCRGELSDVRFLSRGDLPSLPLLPDLVPDGPLLRLQDVLSLLPEPEEAADSAGELRGVLAMLVLRQYRRRASEEAALVSSCFTPAGSPLLRYWLSANNAEKVSILSLSSGGDLWPFALVLPGRAFLKARLTSAHAPAVPAFVTWFDRETLSFSDPCARLGEGDRKLLSACLDAYLAALPEGAPDLSAFLSAFRADLSRESEPYREDPFLKTRLRAVSALRVLPAYAGDLKESVCVYEHFLADDTLGLAFTGSDAFPADTCSEIPEEHLYSWRGTPFAREDSALLLAPSDAPGEDLALKRLEQECALLADYSDDYRDALLANADQMLSRFPSLLPEVRLLADAVVVDAGKPVGEREPVFTWPWDPASPSLATVLHECLGDSLPAAALSPFAAKLAVFPARGNDVIGDSLLSAMCVLPPLGNYDESSGIAPDAVLPPLSPAFGEALCSLPEGRTLLQPGLLAFERTMNDAVRVTLTLDGSFPVRLVRTYAEEEILHLYSHDIPTVALWPSVPFAPGDWNAYYVYAHLPAAWSASVLPEGGQAEGLQETSEDRYTASLTSFPVCLSLFREGESVGFLPNVLPRPVRGLGSPVEICVDFGSSGTSVVFSADRQRRPLAGPVMVRTLLSSPASSRDLLRREFLPAVPVSALLPTVSRLFRNVPGADPEPFADGIVLMSASLEDLLSTPSDAVYTSLKWEEQKGRSGFLCLHQILLMAVLQARCDGAPSVSFRFSLPDEMAREGRENLMNLFLAICGKVLRESGFPVPPEGLPVAFASDSSALGAYFRYCAPDDTRGGFMVLDLGACTAGISLFLRGREQAVRACQIPLGVHYMLLPVLLRDPELLLQEFSFCEDPALRRDLSLLARALSAARTDPVALRRARIALDHLIADHLPLLVSCLLHLASVGTATKTGAVMLFYFAYLLMLSGLVLLQIAADPNKNDFLPEQMALCLAGRGSALIESLPAPLKTGLWHFLSMFRNRRVASLSLLFSAEKKMEIPVGLSMLQEVSSSLPPSSAVPASVSVRPAELLPEFLLRFRREFPASAELLFPGFFTNDYYHPFSERGGSLVAASVDQSFPPTDEPPRPYDSLAAWPGNLLDLLQ